MRTALDQQDMLLAAWRTNNRVTVFLVEHLPHELWEATVPGAPRRTVRMIAGHIHNARCMAIGYRLPVEITEGLWEWSKRARESRS